jgi:ABC-type Mn2+/Zn2+ transport system ATPase subunit
MWGPLNNITLNQRKTDAKFTMIPDAVHPGPAGQVVMAVAIVQDLDLPRKVSNIRIATQAKGKRQVQTSGGELSRIMLAIRNELRRTDGLPTLVFDEVDAGIGGAEAEAVGARLKRLSEDFQILCITHLPQIAVFGKTHLKVSKRVEKGRTRFFIDPVEKVDREREIARMLGGIKITKKTLAHAREMLQEKAPTEDR